MRPHTSSVTSNKALLSQRIRCNEARECPCNSLQPFLNLWKIILWKVRVVYVWGIGNKQHTGVSKANSTSSHILLKTELRIIGERIAMDLFFFLILPPLIYTVKINGYCLAIKYLLLCSTKERNSCMFRGVSNWPNGHFWVNCPFKLIVYMPSCPHRVCM